jgi:hypothetical protein
MVHAALFETEPNGAYMGKELGWFAHCDWIESLSSLVASSFVKKLMYKSF